MYFPRDAISKLPQDSPEHTVPPLQKDILIYLKDFEVEMHITMPEISLWGYETVLKHLPLYVLRNKITKTKQILKGQEESVG